MGALGKWVMAVELLCKLHKSLGKELSSTGRTSVRTMIEQVENFLDEEVGDGWRT